MKLSYLFPAAVFIILALSIGRCLQPAEAQLTLCEDVAQTFANADTGRTAWVLSTQAHCHVEPSGTAATVTVAVNPGYDEWRISGFYSRPAPAAGEALFMFFVDGEVGPYQFDTPTTPEEIACDESTPGVRWAKEASAFTVNDGAATYDVYVVDNQWFDENDLTVGLCHRDPVETVRFAAAPTPTPTPTAAPTPAPAGAAPVIWDFEESLPATGGYTLCLSPDPPNWPNPECYVYGQDGSWIDTYVPSTTPTVVPSVSTPEPVVDSGSESAAAALRAAASVLREMASELLEQANALEAEAEALD